MIRIQVVKWGAVILLALLAFMLLPAYEYFTPDEPIATTLGVTPLSIRNGGGGEAPTCEWIKKDNSAVPDRASSYLTGMEYKVIEKAKIDCSMDPMCKGVQGTTRKGGDAIFRLTTVGRAESSPEGYGATFYEKKDCSRDPQDPPCEWGEPQKDRAPKQDTLNHFFPTMYTAQIACAERPDCKGITKDDKENFFYLSNDDDLRERRNRTFYKKRKCHKRDGGEDEGGDEGSRDWKREDGGDMPFGYSPGPSMSDPPIDDILGGDKAWRSEERHKPRPWWQGTDEDNYVAKSSLVPCTCTTHSMGCQKHGGGRDQSWAPGDMGGPEQYGVMKPFSSAFINQEEPSGFLNAFNAFLR
jgi:hypothetical protein